MAAGIAKGDEEVVLFHDVVGVLAESKAQVAGVLPGHLSGPVGLGVAGYDSELLRELDSAISDREMGLKVDGVQRGYGVSRCWWCEGLD